MLGAPNIIILWHILKKYLTTDQNYYSAYCNALNILIGNIILRQDKTLMKKRYYLTAPNPEPEHKILWHSDQLRENVEPSDSLYQTNTFRKREIKKIFIYQTGSWDWILISIATPFLAIPKVARVVKNSFLSNHNIQTVSHPCRQEICMT